MTRIEITAGDVYSRYDKTRRADAAAYGRNAWLLLGAATGLFTAGAVWFTAAVHIAAAAIN